MEASKDADLILVCDTGSTDGTVERLKELGALVYEIRQKPWRFDVPRNTALNLIPADIDICLSIDLDEYLQPGWAEALDAEWQRAEGQLKRISYDYIWNWKSDGVTPDVRFYADKIHHRHGYYWRHPCHETLYWEGDGHEQRAVIPGIVLHHRADLSKSRGQYQPLLKLAVDESPDNDRMSHYYGRELMFYGKYEQRGSPPPLVYLSGLGMNQFYGHPCVVSSFTYNLPDNVDYIRGTSVNNYGTDLLSRRTPSKASSVAGLGASGNRILNAGLEKFFPASKPAPDPVVGSVNNTQLANYVPTKMEIDITLIPVQTRSQVSKQFSLKGFANGDLIKGGFW
jgi:glycosyltransferase involved in cell wall biosynthesis